MCLYSTSHNSLITVESEDEPQTAWVSAHHPQKIPKKYRGRKMKLRCPPKHTYLTKMAFTLYYTYIKVSNIL